LAHQTGMPLPAHGGMFKLHLAARATLDTKNFRRNLIRPSFINRLDWIATEMVPVKEQSIFTINTILSVCTDQTCPSMSAGKHTHYSWADEENPTPKPMSAPEYLRELGRYTEMKMNDKSVFPGDGTDYMPPGFEALAKTLCRRWFRIYAHAYLHHFQQFRQSGSEAELNCAYKHYLYFVWENHLVDKADLLPLWELSERFLAQSAVPDPQQEGKFLSRPLPPGAKKLARSKARSQAREPGSMSPIRGHDLPSLDRAHAENPLGRTSTAPYRDSPRREQGRDSPSRDHERTAQAPGRSSMTPRPESPRRENGHESPSRDREQGAHAPGRSSRALRREPSLHDKHRRGYPA